MHILLELGDLLGDWQAELLDRHREGRRRTAFIREARHEDTWLLEQSDAAPLLALRVRPHSVGPRLHGSLEFAGSHPDSRREVTVPLEQARRRISHEHVHELLDLAATAHAAARRIHSLVHERDATAPNGRRRQLDRLKDHATTAAAGRTQGPWQLRLAKLDGAAGLGRRSLGGGGEQHLQHLQARGPHVSMQSRAGQRRNHRHVSSQQRRCDSFHALREPQAHAVRQGRPRMESPR